MAFYHCLLFDVDGTLLDFTACEKSAFYELMESYQIQADAGMLQTYQEINQQLWNACERGEIKKDQLVIQRFERWMQAFSISENAVQMNDRYVEFLAQKADLFEDTKEVLSELSEVATLAVITNGIDRVQRKRLEQAGIAQYFDGIFCSSKMVAAKPSRKIFEAALRQLGVEQKDKVLVIGDSVSSDILGAKNAGLDACFCNMTNQQVEHVNAKYTITNLKELYEIVMEPEEIIHVGMQERRHQV